MLSGSSPTKSRPFENSITKTAEILSEKRTAQILSGATTEKELLPKQLRHCYFCGWEMSQQIRGKTPICKYCARIYNKYQTYSRKTVQRHHAIIEKILYHRVDKREVNEPSQPATKG